MVERFFRYWIPSSPSLQRASFQFLQTLFPVWIIIMNVYFSECFEFHISLRKSWNLGFWNVLFPSDLPLAQLCCVLKLAQDRFLHLENVSSHAPYFFSCAWNLCLPVSTFSSFIFDKFPKLRAFSKMKSYFSANQRHGTSNGAGEFVFRGLEAYRNFFPQYTLGEENWEVDFSMRTKMKKGNWRLLILSCIVHRLHYTKILQSVRSV